MEILSILMVAVTVEALTEWVKSLKKDGKVDTQWQNLGINGRCKHMGTRCARS